MPVASDPIGDEELEVLFHGLAARAGVALAVSGGADSLALLCLVDRWRRGGVGRPPVHVLTVDHGLRPGSAAEAAGVAAAAAARGLPHRTLRWEGDKPAAGVEEAAREARYRLLAEAARAVGADCLVTAHHRDDQAETVLMRLGRGSGLSGLAGMRPERALAELTLLRPLLGVPKARLVATAAAAGLTPAEDESNRDPRFARARLRALMPSLADEGITAAGLAGTAARLGRADAALERYTAELIARSASVDALAVARIDRAAFSAAPEEVRLRALAKVIVRLGGADWPPRTERLEALDRLVMAGAPFRRTLGGVAIHAGLRIIEAYREAGRAHISEIEVAAGFAALWDRRFAVAVDRAPPSGVRLGPLSAAGRIEIGAAGLDFRPATVAALPAFRIGGQVVAVPALGYLDPDIPDFAATTRCVVDLPLAPVRAAFPRA